MRIQEFECCPGGTVLDPPPPVLLTSCSSLWNPSGFHPRLSLSSLDFLLLLLLPLLPLLPPLPPLLLPLIPCSSWILLLAITFPSPSPFATSSRLTLATTLPSPLTLATTLTPSSHPSLLSAEADGLRGECSGSDRKLALTEEDERSATGADCTSSSSPCVLPTSSSDALLCLARTALLPTLNGGRPLDDETEEEVLAAVAVAVTATRGL